MFEEEIYKIWPDALEYVKEGYSFCCFTASLGKLVFWWKFNCCFESRRQPLAEKLFTKAPSKEMLCQSCFSPPKNLFPRKVLHKKKRKNNLETGGFFFWRIWCSKWGNEKLSGAYLTLQKIESHFPRNFPRATLRDEGTSKASPNSHRQADDGVCLQYRNEGKNHSPSKSPTICKRAKHGKSCPANKVYQLKRW